MKILITEAVNSAIDAFFDALGNDSYKEQYRETHFNPILIAILNKSLSSWSVKIYGTYRSILGVKLVSKINSQAPNE